MLRKAIIGLTAAGSTAAAEDALPAHADFTHLSCKGAPREIRVTVDNVKRSVGLMTVELFRDEPENFLKKAGREYRLRFAAKSPKTQFCITAPAAGRFAVAVYHDRNANQKFDKGPFGIPAEPFGVSRNPKINLAPPPLEEALVDVGEDGAAVEIRLKD